MSNNKTHSHMKNQTNRFLVKWPTQNPNLQGKPVLEGENFIFSNKIEVQKKTEINLFQPQCSANSLNSEILQSKFLRTRCLKNRAKLSVQTALKTMPNWVYRLPRFLCPLYGILCPDFSSQKLCPEKTASKNMRIIFLRKPAVWKCTFCCCTVLGNVPSALFSQLAIFLFLCSPTHEKQNETQNAFPCLFGV